MRLLPQKPFVALAYRAIDVAFAAKFPKPLQCVFLFGRAQSIVLVRHGEFASDKKEALIPELLGIGQPHH
jgi:hypothetical protein